MGLVIFFLSKLGTKPRYFDRAPFQLKSLLAGICNDSFCNLISLLPVMMKQGRSITYFTDLVCFFLFFLFLRISSTDIVPRTERENSGKEIGEYARVVGLPASKLRQIHRNIEIVT